MNPPAEGFASRLLGPALRAQSDRRLVTLVREGYETAFEEIVRRYGKALGRYAATIVGGRSEDVTQDAFSKALLALRRGDAEIELRPWLFRIVRNTALNDLRDSPPAPEVLAEAIAGGQSPAQALEQREALADLIERLRALPEPQRAAIVMRELEGLSHQEIAAALGLSGGGARQAIYRARRALRSSAGLLVPLPLLRAILAGGGPGTAEAAEAGVIGAGGAAGAGLALKATAATVLVAGAVGTGAVLEQRSEERKPGLARAAEGKAVQDATPSTAAPEDVESGSGHGGDWQSGHSGTSGSGRGSGHDGDGSNSGPSANSGSGSIGSSDDDRSGPGDGSEPADDNSGPGGGGSSGTDDDSSGHDSSGTVLGSSSRPGSGAVSTSSSSSGTSGESGGDADFELEDNSGSDSGFSSNSGSGSDDD